MRYIEEENETPKNTPMMPLLHQTKRCPLDQSWLHVPVQTAHKPPTNRPQTAAQIIRPTEDNKKRNSAPRLRTPLLDRLSQLLGEAPPHSQQLFLRILSLLLAPLNPSSQLLHLVPQLFP
jgi:hypothetical protein